ncbi:membrane protein [Bacteroidia bacterium]|nr:membrane protein [Bacteroidia bacterium]GHU55278.1 membrane protein [Bacteroidia bacterium]
MNHKVIDMKTTIKYISSLFVLFAILLAGCDDEFFNLEPTDRIATNKFWQQEKDGILATNACYQAFNPCFKYISFEGCSDNACTAQTWQDGYMVANGSFNSSWDFVRVIWTDCYKYIRRTNDVIAHVSEIPDINANLSNRLKGEALVIRAFIYNIMINLYGDVPFITEPITLIDDSKKPRESKSVIIDQLIKDLDVAIGYLPVRYTENADKGRITKGAALAVKAKLCLYSGRFSEAREAAQEVIKADYGYRLLPNYADVFDYNHQMNEEIILDDQYMPDLRMHNSFSQLGPRSAQGTSNYVPTRSLIDEYENGDTRRDANFILPGDPNPYIDGTIFDPAPGSGSADEIGASPQATSTGYQYKKYVLKEDLAYPSRCSINIIMIRFADVLLMFAEAENEINGPTAAAYDALNKVRERAKVPEVKDLSKDEFRKVLQKERRVELAGEGLRYFDILRWKIAENVLNGTVNGMDYTDTTGAKKTIIIETRKFDKNRNYLWPIPESELRLNPELTGKQNPGY